MAASGLVPALVVSGFLGAGKTTLVRALLERAQRDGVRVAVISNELGELGIDEALLGGGASESFIELAGGCVCCRLSDTLLETLQLLYDRVQPDRVIIETSGVALPFETQLNLWREPVNAWVGDDAAVVVCSAIQLAEGRELDGTFEEQVSSADLVVLSKLDLLSPADQDRARAALAERVGGVPVVEAIAGDLHPDLLFPPDPDALRAQRRAAGHRPRPHSHERFTTELLEIPPGTDPEALRARLVGLGALRVKGFIAGPEGTLLVQGVGNRVEIGPPAAGQAARALGTLVVIRRAEGHDHHPHDHG
ncbi:GTP-binding protein [Myxococcota bacterium]|nr:GTP-binding protein [Myxococcota bacterium]